MVTHDKQYLTCDTWWGVNILSNVSFLVLTVWDGQYLEDSERKDHRLNLRINELRMCL